MYPGIRLGIGLKVEPGAIVKEPPGEKQIHSKLILRRFLDDLNLHLGSPRAFPA